MKVDTTELGTLYLPEDKLGTIALYAAQAADLYEIQGAHVLSELARTTAREIFTALDKSGRYDDIKRKEGGA